MNSTSSDKLHVISHKERISIRKSFKVDNWITHILNTLSSNTLGPCVSKQIIYKNNQFSWETHHFSKFKHSALRQIYIK